MEINQGLLQRMAMGITHPTVLGRVIQICLCYKPNQKQNRKDEQVVRMYELDSFANVEAMDIAQAVAFFVSLNEATAIEIALAMKNLPEKGEGDAARWKRFIEFQHGFFLGFLKGVARSEGYTEETVRKIGGYYADILAQEFSTRQIESSAYIGDLSNAVAAVSSGSFPFVDQFMLNASRKFLFLKPVAQKVVEGFLHAEVHRHETLEAKMRLWPRISADRSLLLVGTTQHP